MLAQLKSRGWKGIYGWAMKTWGCGYGILVGKIYGIINLVLLVSTYMIVKGLPLGFIESLIIGIVGVSVIFISGIIFVKMGLLKAEADSNFIENPQQLEMYHRIQRIEDKLDKMGELYEQKP